MSDKKKFQNLLLMAAADGSLTESELQLLSHRATEWGITDQEFEDAIQDAIAGEAKVSVPSDVSERRSLLKDLVRMMAADGKIVDEEKRLFAVLSAVMEISGDDLNQIIDEVLSDTSE